MQSEVWKPVPEFEGIYEVSNMGRVRRLSLASESVRRIHPHRNYGPRIVGGRALRNGYLYVDLSINNKQTRWAIHSLVLTVFKGERPNGMYGCHNDGDKRNNSVENLRWDTPTENQKDRLKHGRHQFAEANGSSKLTNQQRRKIVEMREGGLSFNKIAKQFCVCAQTVLNVCKSRTHERVESEAAA